MSTASDTLFPLCDNKLAWEERGRAAELLLSGKQLSMGPECFALEHEFAAAVGASSALFVNSGSSANMLAVVAACHPSRPKRLARGDKMLVPALCWSTTVAPLVFMGLQPVLVDVSPQTLQMDVDHARALVQSDPGIRGLMLVHVMGGCPDMNAIMQLVTDHDLVFIEDACEAMGNSFSGKALGTWADFGTFSTFYSHHMTSVEGGFLVVRDDHDARRCVMLREHGWIRRLPASEQARHVAAEPSVDPRFLFADLGFNFRPTDITAVIGRVQLRKLPQFNAARKSNFLQMKKALASVDDVRLPTMVWGADVAYLALVLLYDGDGDFTVFKNVLEHAGVETRPVISGNFARQPCLHLWGVPQPEATAYPGAEAVHWKALYVGLHGRVWTDEECATLASIVKAAANEASKVAAAPAAAVAVNVNVNVTATTTLPLATTGEDPTTAAPSSPCSGTQGSAQSLQ